MTCSEFNDDPPIPGQGDSPQGLKRASRSRALSWDPRVVLLKVTQGFWSPTMGSWDVLPYTADWQERHRERGDILHPLQIPALETPVSPAVSPDEHATARNWVYAGA